MATVGVGLVICWLIALRVVDRRRAFFVVVMLALYPIFNFKGFKYNPDLLQLVTLPLVVLAYLNAFEKRSVASGLWLGLAGALALMTKYWVLTMIGAIGLAALIHPERLTIPAFAGAVGCDRDARGGDDPASGLAEEVDFVPLTYAGDTYSLSSRPQTHAAGARLYRPQSGAARAAGGAGRARAGLVPPWWTLLLQRPSRWSRAPGRAGQFGRRPFAGAQRLDHPDHRRDRAAARRVGLQNLHEDRLGHLAVLPGAAGAGRDPGAARAAHGAVQHHRDLARAQRSRRWPHRPGSPRARWRTIRTTWRSMARARSSPAS